MADVKHVCLFYILHPDGQSLTTCCQGIDHELKRACEEVISSCAEAVCRPIHSWLERVAQYHDSGAKEPLASQGWASQQAATALMITFQEACHRDLRSAVARLRLYLEDDRTVNVLVKHAQEKVVDEYADFRRVIWSEYGEKLSSEVSSEEALRELLADVCGEEDSSGSRAGGSDHVA